MGAQMMLWGWAWYMSIVMVQQFPMGAALGQVPCGEF